MNLPGSPFGTTAPKSIDPATGKPYGSRYPWPTIEDMVHSQKRVLDHLGIKRLRSIAGGSLGGMQVLMWCALYPDFSDSIIAMASGAAVPVTGIAWHLIGRKIIEADARFNGGDYYDNPEPLRGLQVARMVGHMTYLSAESLQRKFGRRRRGNTRQFEIDSYFEYQGKKFASSYDANSYIRVQAAMDEMDLEEQYGSLAGSIREMAGPEPARLVRHRLAFSSRQRRSCRGRDAVARSSRPSRADLLDERTRHVPDRLPPDHRAGARVSVRVAAASESPYFVSNSLKRCSRRHSTRAFVFLDRNDEQRANVRSLAHAAFISS